MRIVTSLFFVLTLLLPAFSAFAGTKTFTASETVIMGEKDSKDGVRKLCLDRARRAILEQAGVYLESTSTVKNLALDKDELRLFSAAFIPFRPSKVEFTPRGDTLEVSCAVEADVDPEDVKRQVLEARKNEALMKVVKETREDMRYLYDYVLKLAGDICKLNPSSEACWPLILDVGAISPQ